MTTVMSYKDKYDLNNQQNHTISQKSHRTKKNIIFSILFTKLQILTNILMPIEKVGETQILEITTRNPEITKRGRPITNGSMKTH